jgi:hypothetical protein
MTIVDLEAMSMAGPKVPLYAMSIRKYLGNVWSLVVKDRYYVMVVNVPKSPLSIDQSIKHSGRRTLFYI